MHVDLDNCVIYIYIPSKSLFIRLMIRSLKPATVQINPGNSLFQ